MNLQSYINKEAERLKETKFAKEGGSCFECCDYDGMYADLEVFLTHSLLNLIKEVREEIPDIIIPGIDNLDDQQLLDLETKFCEGFNLSRDLIIKALEVKEENFNLTNLTK